MKLRSFSAKAVLTFGLRPLAQYRAVALPLLLLASMPLSGDAHESGQAHIHFQKPNLSGQSSNEGLQFRSSSQAAQARIASQRSTEPAEQTPQVVKRVAAKPRSTPAKRAVQEQAVAKTPAYVAAAERRSNASHAQASAASYRDESVEQTGFFLPEAQTRRSRGATQSQYCDSCVGGYANDPGCGIIDPGCGMMDPGCGIAEPGCGVYDPGCGIAEPTCGCNEPGCGICDAGCGVYDPGCGVAEPDCGCDVGCGTCINDPADDYACIPICIPRFKYLDAWAGVHGFKGPRDILGGGPGDGNFGFQEGINIAGRAPIIGLMFPEISYQLGYQAVQSRLSGTSDNNANDRSQQFFTGGFFRRVPVGLQYGAVFDLMHDTLVQTADFHQIRYEISLKSPKGREFGFWGTSSTNSKTIGGINYAAVNQYAGFYRWHFRNGAVGRIWGGGTDDGEGLVGADFQAPLNNRWSMQGGFNYLISDADAGLAGARQESWNVGMNLVWHYGKSARRAANDPFRPMFRVANNGWMFIDQK